MSDRIRLRIEQDTEHNLRVCDQDGRAVEGIQSVNYEAYGPPDRDPRAAFAGSRLSLEISNAVALIVPSRIPRRDCVPNVSATVPLGHSL